MSLLPSSSSPQPPPLFYPYQPVSIGSTSQTHYSEGNFVGDKFPSRKRRAVWDESSEPGIKSPDAILERFKKLKVSECMDSDGEQNVEDSLYSSSSDSSTCSFEIPSHSAFTSLPFPTPPPSSASLTENCPSTRLIKPLRGSKSPLKSILKKDAALPISPVPSIRFAPSPTRKKVGFSGTTTVINLSRKRRLRDDEEVVIYESRHEDDRGRNKSVKRIKIGGRLDG